MLMFYVQRIYYRVTQFQVKPHHPKHSTELCVMLNPPCSSPQEIENNPLNSVTFSGNQRFRQ